METSETIGKITKALAAAQAEIKGAIKESDNTFFKSRYADLSSVWDACRDVLPKNGLAIFQTGDGSTAETVSVCTMISHESGEWVRGSVTMKLSKCDPQGAGSALTYGRRYGLAAMVGVCPEDDDGAIASNTTKPLSKAQERPGFANGRPVEELDKEIAQREAQATPQSDLGDFEDVVLSVDPGAKGNTNGRAWQAYRITTQDHGVIGTFDAKVVEVSKKAVAGKLKVRFECEPSKHGPKAKAALIIDPVDVDQLPF